MEEIGVYYYQGYFSFSVLFLFFLSTVGRLLDGIFFVFGVGFVSGLGLGFCFQNSLVDRIDQRWTKLGQKLKAFLSMTPQSLKAL